MSNWNEFDCILFVIKRNRKINYNFHNSAHSWINEHDWQNIDSFSLIKQEQEQQQQRQDDDFGAKFSWFFQRDSKKLAIV